VHISHDQLQHLVLVSQDQQIERRPLAALDPLDQFEVTFDLDVIPNRRSSLSR
jgi:hypothetical protein